MSPARDGRPDEFAVPATFDQLSRVLQSRLADLTPSQQKLAARVLSDPESCAFMTVTDMAEAVGVNESTVVRFASALGLDGYPGLARLCKEALREKAQLVQRFESLQELQGAGNGNLLERAAALDQGNIVRTFARLDDADWERAVGALADCRTLYVIGMRKCYTVAYLLAYLLGMVRDGVQQIPSGPGMFPDVLRRVGPEDAFVGISIHRYTRETVRALAFAHRRGATTIALTDNAASALAPHADISFYVETSSASILRSLTAFVSIAQAITTGVATRLGMSTRSELLLEEEVLGDFDVYVARDPVRLSARPVHGGGRPHSEGFKSRRKGGASQ